ncbi:hypothetical protein R1sor_008944 [Riccia sorocarpa]|uniref:Reverse transcriptase Ty1/copia-type domain-containing protein n=1 Tax=Riccia sorocarpa TaxID=122646 RepID=A0ABD3H4E3_9MARC
MTNYLRLEFKTTREGIFMSQQSYVTGILEDLNMQDCNASSTPMEEGLQLLTDMGAPEEDGKLYREVVGKMLYLANTRLDVSFAIFMALPLASTLAGPISTSTKRVSKPLLTLTGLAIRKPDVQRVATSFE